jgi:transposase-like protein
MAKCPKCKKGELVLKTGEKYIYVCEDCHHEVNEQIEEWKRQMKRREREV